MRDYFDLKGQVALVTGCSGGLGVQMARALAAAGCNIVPIARRLEKLEEVAASLRADFGVEALPLRCDITSTEQVGEVVDKVMERFGRIDILVNNAGQRGGYISNATESEYDDIMDTNAKGTFFLTQLVAKYMIENKIEGNILNISSASSIRPATSAYHMSKWAIRGLTMGLARSLAPHGIVVNAIAPGPTATPMLMSDDRGGDVSHPRNLLGRYALPAEIGNMAVILVSDMSRTIIGDTLFMSGGSGVITNEDVDFNF